MTDPVSTSALGALAKATDETSSEAAKAAGNLLTRLLGPSADVVGADWAERLRQQNLRRLLEKTQKRADNETNPGFTKPRLAAATFEAAQYADDEVVAEYLSGVLASSRAPEGGSDAGLPWSSLIGRLSTDQLLLHFLVYASARPDLCDLAATNHERRANPLDSTGVLIPTEELLQRFGFSDSFFRRLGAAIDGLTREGLLSDAYAYGNEKYLSEFMKVRGSTFSMPFPGGVYVGVTIHGMRLFLWGTGNGDEDTDAYVNEEIVTSVVDEDLRLVPIEGVRRWSSYWSPEVPISLPQSQA